MKRKVGPLKVTDDWDSGAAAAGWMVDWWVGQLVAVDWLWWYKQLQRDAEREREKCIKSFLGDRQIEGHRRKRVKIVVNFKCMQFVDALLIN